MARRGRQIIRTHTRERWFCYCSVCDAAAGRSERAHRTANYNRLIISACSLPLRCVLCIGQDRAGSLLVRGLRCPDSRLLNARYHHHRRLNCEPTRFRLLRLGTRRDREAVKEKKKKTREKKVTLDRSPRQCWKLGFDERLSLAANCRLYGGLSTAIITILLL